MIEQVRPAAFDEWLKRHAAARPLVLDVREDWETQLASPQAEGFELLRIPMAMLPARLAELDSDRPIACLCHHGARSMRAASFLVHQGFADIANIAGGIDAWTQERDPTVARY